MDVSPSLEACFRTPLEVATLGPLNVGIEPGRRSINQHTRVSMRLLTVDASIKCAHQGRVGLVASQQWFTIVGSPVLLRPDPEGRPISACPNIGPSIKPCTSTLKVQAGYSTFVSAGGRPVCLQSLTGLTDGTPPGVVPYLVASPGQSFVEAVS